MPDGKAKNENADKPSEQRAAPHQLFDRVFKRLMHLSGSAIIRFLNAAFNRNYPLDSTVEYLSTESITGKLNQLLSDILILVNRADKYIFEAQMTGDENMALRIFTYSYEEALKTRLNEAGRIKIRLVPALAIYLEPGAAAPPELVLEVTDIEGKPHEFRFPVMRLFDYTIAELEQRDMGILLPFYLLKLRGPARKAKSGERRRELSGEMRELLEELIAAVERDGRMSASDMRVVLGLTGNLYIEMYKSYPEFAEATKMMEEELMTVVDIAEERGLQRGLREGRREGRQEGRQEGVLQFFNLLAQGKTPDEAKHLLGVE